MFTIFRFGIFTWRLHLEWTWDPIGKWSLNSPFGEYKSFGFILFAEGSIMDGPLYGWRILPGSKLSYCWASWKIPHKKAIYWPIFYILTAYFWADCWWPLRTLRSRILPWWDKTLRWSCWFYVLDLMRFYCLRTFDESTWVFSSFRQFRIWVHW